MNRRGMSIAARAWLVLVSAAVMAPAAALAQGPAETLTPLQVAVACAPPASLSTMNGHLRIVGAQSTVPRTLFGLEDKLVINGGIADGVSLGQRYFVRRRIHFGSPGDDDPMRPRSVQTGGWVRVAAVNANTAIATVEHVCGPLYANDYLEPFTVPDVPPDAGRIDTSGALDFSTLARVLYADDERPMAANGEFMVMDQGSESGIAPGARFAIYRDLHVEGVPLSPVGEAVVVTTGAWRSVVRISATRDAVRAGDLLVPRKAKPEER